MTKVKIAVWGITDAIWGSLKDKIDPRRAEIVFFIDNNADRIGGLYASRPVYCFNEIQREQLQQLDCIIVAAYSGYQSIRGSLLKGGYPEEKVQLYITPWITMYDLGELSHIRRECIDEIYFEPGKRWSELQKYIEAYAEYSACECLEEHKGRWYEKGPLISHACGGVVDSNNAMYTNSKEALEYSFSKQFRLVECDVLGYERNEVILAHDFDRLYEAEEVGYTIQNFEEMLRALKQHPETHMLVDVKWSNIEEYDFYVTSIVDTIHQVANNEQEKCQLYAQIVMEVYDEPSIQYAQKAGFDVFFTQYRNADIRNFMNTVKICEKYGIGVVGYDVGFIKEYIKGVSMLKKKGIRVYAYSTNSEEEYYWLRRHGIDGVFTDWLTYEDVATP